MQPDLHRDGFCLSFDTTRLDTGAIHAFLSESYWARNRSRETVDRALANSLCIGLYEGERQIGFARAVTDRATFAYLADVYVLQAFRGRGLGRWMVGALLEHPDLAGLRRWLLMTQDAHGLYERLGFRRLERPGDCMERLAPVPVVDG